MIAFGENLKAAREYRGLTQRELADRAGVTQGHVAQIERGVAWPSLPVALMLARSLRVTVDFLTSDFYNQEDLVRAPFLPKPEASAEVAELDD